MRFYKRVLSAPSFSSIAFYPGFFFGLKDFLLLIFSPRLVLYPFRNGHRPNFFTPREKLH